MSDNLEYYITEERIHYFKWYVSNDRTNREFAIMAMDIINSQAEHTTLYVLHDYTAIEVTPIAVIIQGMKRIHIPPGITVKLAHVYSYHAHKTIIQDIALITSLSSVNRQFFKADKKAEAIQWLLSDD